MARSSSPRSSSWPTTPLPPSQGDVDRQVGARLDQREVLAVGGGGAGEVAALLHHRLLGAEPLGELLAEPRARVDRVELDVPEGVPLRLLAARLSSATIVSTPAPSETKRLTQPISSITARSRSASASMSKPSSGT